MLENLKTNTKLASVIWNRIKKKKYNTVTVQKFPVNNMK
jgi:hypothetical protein